MISNQMNRQNNFLTRTRQLIRRCSCCRSEGHNITQCNDPNLINFQTILTNRRDELREIHSIDLNNKISYFETWLYGQDHNLVKSYAMRFCGAYSRNNLQICVQKIISLIWNIQPDSFGSILPIYNYNSLPALPIPLPISIMDISQYPIGYIDNILIELLDSIRNNNSQPNENKKFEINTVLCVEVEDLEKEEECNICYEKTKNLNMVTLNCKHKFCGGCVSQTLKKCNKFKLPNCALCRTKIDCILVNNPEIINTLKENLL